MVKIKVEVWQQQPRLVSAKKSTSIDKEFKKKKEREHDEMCTHAFHSETRQH
jgi:hypothetical protein